MATSSTSSTRPKVRCCRCNGSAKCLRCACVRSNIPCSYCLPGESGNCHNTLPSSQSLGSTQPRPQTAHNSPEPPSAPRNGTDLPTLESIMSSYIPTLHHVPKGARDTWAATFSSSLSAVTSDPSNASNWLSLLMLPKCVLANPPSGHRLRWREILSLVKSRLKRWEEGDISSLWKEVVDGSEALSRRCRNTSHQLSNNLRRATRAAQNGQYSKAMKALTSDGLANVDDAVYEEMLGKHPQASTPHLPSDPVTASLMLTDSTILKGVKSFPPESAPGPSGLRPSHLREAVLCPSPDRAHRMLFSLTSFVNLLGSGQAPSFVLPHLCGASLLALRKKSSGLRPIAVGETLCRLTSKCLASAVRSSALSRLFPNQLGVGVKGGCEAIIHAVSSHLTASTSSDRCWTLLLDFSNAFNSIDREAMFREFREHIPAVSPWIEACYACQPILQLGKYSLRSCHGVQQGDPLGPLGFALTLQSIVDRIESEVPNLALNAWYLDDGTLVGSPDDLLAALRILERDGPSIGLHLNKAKSILYIPEDADPASSPLAPEIPVTRQGFSLFPLRSPLLRESLLVSFPPLIDMLKFGG